MDSLLAPLLPGLLVLIVYLLLAARIKSCTRRKWCGLLLSSIGLLVLIHSPSWLQDLHTYPFASGVILMGWLLFLDRNEYRRARSNTPAHPLWTAPTSNLAPNFPTDALMHQLLQLLHEEIGLSKHQTLRLDTAINLDFKCEDREVRHFIQVFRQEFSVHSGDFKARRYVCSPLTEILVKCRLLKCRQKIPLTIGMLYQALKNRRWNTRTLEAL
ncbi:DUF1493 family protein [Pseudomonas sp. RGM2987]|uniref:DUF1493 family protein n=1 Tax=Pseudomonas sp. RGM2987 TaxID=2930090 RepID=UPI001FD63FAD|nr:DUF1493 family protein [Pseudomonas sp. RGM2987]MCJ8206665.1 DUF1493 family protein [Pseudomonas sp. RGM2987]